MYKNAEELIKQCNEKGKRIWEIALDNEIKLTGMTRERVMQHFSDRLDIMFNSALKALETKQATKGGLIDGVANCQYEYSKGESITGNYINYVMSLAYSCSEVNASMGKICASPTAGSCGIVPAVLLGVMESKKISREKTLEALITASAVGAIYTKNATVAGADGGCQAECGVASSMAAAAAAYMMGATDERCLDAAGFAMINVMGLVCDPVAGLVALPCAQRNASGAVNALISADMALAGQVAHIPFDQVVDSMFKVGKMLPPQLRETAMGGIATTPAGQAIYKEIFG
ncbi:MAG: L-serine ammonia-lyase, iron-sulfur-dependent, subunit alpha [Oscillospiraceae bacterium]|nr:L-serine ammonia-lyase, iron-sulfur-dependent, subunit alpha [Oscillospiraceae bacterium]